MLVYGTGERLLSRLMQHLEQMVTETDPLAQFGIGCNRSQVDIKDIAAKRSWMINKDHLAKLIDLGLVELREDIDDGSRTVWE